VKKTYCTQNNGDCLTCSLVSYGRDCRNNPLMPEDELLETAIRAVAERHKEEIITELAAWVTYNFDNAVKYVVCHESDPPWDHSGMLIELDERLDENDYDKVQDFLDEYNGKTEATSLSGLGFGHDTYEYQLRGYVNSGITPRLIANAFRELRDQFPNCFRQIITQPDASDEQIYKAIIDECIAEDFIWGELEELISNLIVDFPFYGVIVRGRPMAMEWHKQDRLKEEQRQAELEAGKVRAEEALDTIKKEYFKATGADLPERIHKESEHFPLFWGVLLNSTIPEDTICDFGRYGGFISQNHFTRGTMYRLSRFDRQYELEQQAKAIENKKRKKKNKRKQR